MNTDTGSCHRLAIELARENQWQAAHELIQIEDDCFACRIHACPHRIEGDQDNARYWYQRASATVRQCSTDDELPGASGATGHLYDGHLPVVAAVLSAHDPGAGHPHGLAGNHYLAAEPDENLETENSRSITFERRRHQ